MSTLLIIALSVIGAVLLFFGIKSKSFQKILCGITSMLGSLVIGLLKKNKEQKEKIKKQENAIKAQETVVKKANEINGNIEKKENEIQTEIHEQIKEVNNEKNPDKQIHIYNSIVDNFNNKRGMSNKP